jgi:hypothetical protein
MAMGKPKTFKAGVTIHVPIIPKKRPKMPTAKPKATRIKTFTSLLRTGSFMLYHGEKPVSEATEAGALVERESGEAILEMVS